MVKTSRDEAEQDSAAVQKIVGTLLGALGNEQPFPFGAYKKEMRVIAFAA